MNQRSHLQKIADILGISKMTVSRAMREGTSVDPELRAKIRETAVRLGYQPDSRISRLMSEIRKFRETDYRETLGFIWTHQSAKTTKSFFQEGFEGARARAASLGFKLDEFYLKDDALSGRALSRILYSRGIRGVIIASPVDQRSYPHTWLEWDKFCCVLLGRSMANTGLARVQHDHFSGTVQAIRHLRRLHYKKIGLVLAHSMDERSLRQVSSAYLGFSLLPVTDAERLIYTSQDYEPKALAAWIKKSRPDVVLANFDNPFPTPEQLRRALPASVALASLNWSSDHPEISGIMQQRFNMGEEAIDLLVRRLQQNRMGLDTLAPTIMIPGTWTDATPVMIPPATIKK